MEGFKMVQTVVKEKYESEFFQSEFNLSGKIVKFEICGQTVDRCFEDRSVYLNINETIVGWLKGEDAIKLGQMLINHGQKALIANMINHQHIHMYSILMRYLSKDIVEKVIMEVVDENPANYGSGFRTYKVSCVWKENKEPEFDKDFCFETVVYWSPFEKEFKDQIERWGGEKLIIQGYDREKELDIFNKNVEEL